MKILLASLLLISTAWAAPSIQTIENALNLSPGRSVDVMVGNETLRVTYVRIEPLGGHRYSIVVEAK